jgi:hypothetical protein
MLRTYNPIVVLLSLRLCASHEKIAYTVRKVNPAALQKLIIIYIKPLGHALEAFKVLMLILCENFN